MGYHTDTKRSLVRRRQGDRSTHKTIVRAGGNVAAQLGHTREDTLLEDGRNNKCIQLSGSKLEITYNVRWVGRCISLYTYIYMYVCIHAYTYQYISIWVGA